MQISSTVPVQQLGDPLFHLAMPSSGPGSAGIGLGGKHGGDGTGDGPNAGPGSGGEGVYQPGRGGVTTPRLIYQVDPEYSEEARKIKAQGTVSLSIVIDGSGHVRDVRVTRGLGVGLDERAIEAVRKWRFEPGKKAGKAVPVSAVIEVNFRLL
jgi:TonB family protein